MTTRGRVLENHTLVVRDGRILDLLPSADAADRYAATVAVERPAHLLMPGMINTHTHAAMSLFRGIESPLAALEQRFVGPEFVRDGVLGAIAEMLSSGVTCFGDRYYYPDQCARAAGEQGVRAVIGLPVADAVSPWAKSSAEYLTEGLRVRDDYAGHPLISVVFAPHVAPYAEWRTITYQLAWEAGRWLEVDEADRNGPDPAVPDAALVPDDSVGAMAAWPGVGVARGG